MLCPNLAFCGLIAAVAAAEFDALISPFDDDAQNAIQISAFGNIAMDVIKCKPIRIECR